MERYTTLNHIQYHIQNNKITLGGLVLHYLNNIEVKRHPNAIAVPAGTRPNEMPVGVQLLGKLFNESKPLAIAQTI